ALHAHDLPERVHDVDEVGLVGHHLFDAVVGLGNLVDHARILATFDALGLPREVRRREPPLRLGAAHAPSRAVRARAERLRVALAAHDERARAHAAGDDAQLANACANRTLA